jgi:hypothetical protein
MSEKNEWKPIDSAPQTGRTLLLGYANSRGNWRTVRGQWMSSEYIGEFCEEPEDVEAGWFETSAEADEGQNCWPINPTHWMPLPAAPCPTCNDQGAVGNVLNAQSCPDCTHPASAQPESQREGHPHDDPRFVALCREHDILGTAMQGMAAVFWREGGSPAPSAPGDAQDGLAEAQRLAQALFQRHFAQDDDYASGRVQWEVLGDLPGALSQIDNMVSGLVRPAAPAAGDAQMLEFVREVAQQKPEKPDYWSSCGQCERNISTAEDLLEAYPAIAQQSQRKEA